MANGYMRADLSCSSQPADTWAFMLLRLFSKNSVLFCWSKAPDEDPANFLLPKIPSQVGKLVVETAEFKGTLLK